MSKIDDLVLAITSNNYSKMTQLLEEMTPDEVNSEFVGRSHGNEMTGSALHAACLSNNTVALAALLDVDGIDVNTRLHSYYPTDGHTWAGLHLGHNYRRFTPLMVAATLRHGEPFAMLVRDDRVQLRDDAMELSKEYGHNLLELNREYGDNLVRLRDQDLKGMKRKSVADILDSIRMWIGREVFNDAAPTAVQLEITDEFQSNFSDLLENGEMSDFEIICRGKVIRCHKLILQTRSNVMRRMLVNDMKESNENHMVIDDLDCEIVEAALGFMYSGKVSIENLEANGIKLLEVADRFELKGLTKLCEDHLTTTIDNNNALDMVIMADMFNANIVRKASIQWIVQHRHHIVKRKRVEKLLMKSPKLLFDIFDAFSTKM